MVKLCEEKLLVEAEAVESMHLVDINDHDAIRPCWVFSRCSF